MYRAGQADVGPRGQGIDGDRLPGCDIGDLEDLEDLDDLQVRQGGEGGACMCVRPHVGCVCVCVCRHLLGSAACPGWQACQHTRFLSQLGMRLACILNSRQGYLLCARQVDEVVKCGEGEWLRLHLLFTTLALLQINHVQVDELLEWSSALDFARYADDWQSLATTLGSEAYAVPIPEGSPASSLPGPAQVGYGAGLCMACMDVALPDGVIRV